MQIGLSGYPALVEGTSITFGGYYTRGITLWVENAGRSYELDGLNVGDTFELDDTWKVAAIPPVRDEKGAQGRSSDVRVYLERVE